MLLRLGLILKTSGRNALTLFHACRQPGTPMSVKLATVLLAIYAISPVDLIPDVLPILGWADDVTLLAFAIPALLKMVPASVMAEVNLAKSQRTGSRWQFWRRKS